MTIDWKPLSKSVLAFAICACFFVLAAVLIVLFDPHVEFVGPPTSLLQKLAALFHPKIAGALLLVTAGVCLALCCLGLPLQFVMQKFRLNHWLAFLIAGAVAGAILFSVIRLGLQCEDADPCETGAPLVSWLAIPFATLFGLATGGLFWLVRRPDKDHKPNRQVRAE